MKNSKIFVNGPINLIRMEGSVNNTKKIFYFFMDMHINPLNQTECNDIRSIHIRNYLINNFDEIKNNTTKYDFFLEIFPEVISVKSNYTSIYINQLRNMFNSIFSYNFKKNKINNSDEFPNIRFHYIDIRSYLTFSVNDPYGLIKELKDYVYSLENKIIDLNTLTKINDIVNILTSRLNIIFDFIHKKLKFEKNSFIIPDNIKVTYTEQDYINIIGYFINKIINSYKNDNVKEELNKIFINQINILHKNYSDTLIKLKNYVKSMSDEINHKENELIIFDDTKTYFVNIQKNLSEKIISKLIEYVSELYITTSNIYILIMDIFLLRRILDKNYITNGIIYTGSIHSAAYILYLSKNFNFNITHCYYPNNISEINDNIKKTKTPRETLNLFKPPILEQCIEVSNFPKKFL